MAKTGVTVGRGGRPGCKPRQLIKAVVLACAVLVTYAEGSPESNTQTNDSPSDGISSDHNFTIDARTLSEALIQFSQQSNQAIVFSDRLTRDILARPFIGTAGIPQALDALLSGTNLSWELVDERIIAVLKSGCMGSSTVQSGCVNSQQTLHKYPVYDPGMEETYVYGRQVTGSRIRHKQYGQASPVDVISAPEIEASGAQTIGELLKFVPAVAGNSTSTAISNGGDGTATVTLRGLPASNTLVLINGKRVANNGLAGESVDLNSIPPAAVERIEILKGGASAIYGSDAIAGVVNVIMKRDFHGLLLETYFGESSEGDLQTQTHTLQYGTGLPNGSFFFSASAYEQEPIFSRDRAVSRSADTRSLGGADLRSSATETARVTLPNGQTVILDGGSYRAATDEDLFDFQRFTTAVVPIDRVSLYSNVSYDFSEQLAGMIEVQYLKTDAEATLAPTPVFTAFEQVPLTISRDNFFNPFGADIEDARRRLTEFPVRRQRDESETNRFAITLEGLFDDWNWDVNYNWSRSKASQTISNLVNTDRLARGLGSADNCRGFDIDGCVPINLLGPAGSISPEQVKFLIVPAEVSGYYKLSTVNLTLRNEQFDLPYGKGALAMGLDYRKESTSKRPSELIASIGTLGGTNFEPTRGDRQIAEFYAETVMPVWQSADAFYELGLEAALRVSNYSDFGYTTNPKLGFKLQAGPSVQFRATYAEGFRAPSLNELYQGSSEEQSFINDPCTQTANVGVLPGCTQQADPTRNQFLTVLGGNEELKPETAESYGLGLVWTPRSLPGVTASVDFFVIDQDNVVDSSAQFIVDQNASNGIFSSQVQRDDLGNLQLIQARNLNVGRRRISGTDLAIAYRHRKRPWGQLSVSASGTYIGTYKAKLDDTSEELELSGTFRDEASEGLGGIPEWKGQLGLQWALKRWMGNYEMHFISSLEESIPGTMVTRMIDSWSVHDLQLSYTFDVLSGLRWAVGVDNVFDEEAPLATSAFNDNIDGRTHELKGRFWYTKLSQTF